MQTIGFTDTILFSTSMNAVQDLHVKQGGRPTGVTKPGPTMLTRRGPVGSVSGIEHTCERCGVYHYVRPNRPNLGICRDCLNDRAWVKMVKGFDPRSGFKKEAA